MAELGNGIKVYITSAAVTAISGVTANDALVGETTNNLDLSANLIEVTDKTTAWAERLSGVKSGSLTFTINVDRSNTAHKSLVSSLKAGSAIHCFVGDLAIGGEAFDAVISSISMAAENASVATYNVSASTTGEVKTIAAA